MKVPLLDLVTQYQSIKPEIDRKVLEVLESQYFILGPVVSECELLLSQYLDHEFCLGVSSGTDALLIAMMAEGIGPGDEIITSPYTFFATGGCIARLGATPVFADIDPKSFNIDPSRIEEKITTKTRAIVPVHLYGQLADMDAIMGIAQKHNLIVIEDAAQALGARIGSRHAGTFGDYGCFSFFPSKNLGGAGDGGFVTTNSGERFEKLKKLRVHGSAPKYFHSLIGGNFRLDAIQAAVICAKLPYLDGWIESRRSNAQHYRKLIQDAGLLNGGQLSVPDEVSGFHSYNQFVLVTQPGHRDPLRKALSDAGVGTEIYYPVPLHLQECFRYLGYQAGDFPLSEFSSTHSMAIPIYPELTDQQKIHVVKHIAHYFNQPST